MHCKVKIIVLSLFLLLALLLGRTASPVRAQATDDKPNLLALAALRNATYRSAYADGDEVTLVDGQAGTADAAQVTLTGYIAYGDVTGDGVEDAAAILATNTAGTADIYELAVFVAADGDPVNLATLVVGDRMILNDLQIEDGQIVLARTGHSPTDADCCPTEAQQVVYALTNDELALVSKETTPEAEPAGVFAPAADPTVATLTLGGTDAFWLDPTLVSLHSGATTGPRVDASKLGQGCAGTMNEQPEVVLNWTADAQVTALHLFLLTMGDPTLVVVTPTGDVLCNDDLNPLVLDPYLTIDQPATGRYAIYMGSFANRTTTAGFLVVTSQSFSPATLDLAQLFPRQANPGAVSEPKSIDLLAVDAPLAATASISLTELRSPVQAVVVAGGELGAYEINLGNELCTGFISAAPNYRFDWGGAAEQLAIFFEGAADTTLVVRDPAGGFLCNDDADGAKNLNPYLTLTPIPGQYNVWVGSFAPTAAVTGTVTLTTATDLWPTPLTSDK